MLRSPLLGQARATQGPAFEARAGLGKAVSGARGNYFLSVTGECLPLKRWLQVTPEGG